MVRALAEVKLLESNLDSRSLKVVRHLPNNMTFTWKPLLALGSKLCPVVRALAEVKLLESNLDSRSLKVVRHLPNNKQVCRPS